MATVSWVCPAGCGNTSDQEGTCESCFVPLVPASRPQSESTTASAGEAAPACRLALDTPWRRIDLPDGKQVIVGRGGMSTQCAERFDHVSWRHLMITATAGEDTAVIVDLESTNQSYVGGVPLPRLQPTTLRIGETVRLGKDEGPDRTALCTLIALTPEEAP